MGQLAKIDPLPWGLALLGLGGGVAAVTFLSLAADDVTFARTQWFAMLAMLLALPAILLHAWKGNGAGLWWQAFWTAGLLAYLLHFWWSVGIVYGWSVGAVIDRQGIVGYSNFLVTALWIADVAVAALRPKLTTVTSILRTVAWLAVTISFVAASAFFRSGTVAMLGYVMLTATLALFAFRVFSLGLGRS
jgi:hypothetical protein